MYTPGTVLALKEPKSKPESKKGADDGVVFPYDEVEVIGPSPIYHSGQSAGEWEGVSAQGVILRPMTEFATNLDEPLGRVQRLYSVVSEPERAEAEIKVETYNAHSRQAGPSPEEAFAEASGPTPKSPTRVRTQHSPLQESDPGPEGGSPLEGVDRERARLARGAARS